MTDSEYRELTAEDLAHRWRQRTLTEYVDEAITYAGQNAEEYATADSALRHVLVIAWSDFHEARCNAIGGVWSIACDNQVAAIVGLTRLVGPVSWEEIPAALTVDGVYERIHEAIGTPTPLSDAERERAREVLNRRR